MKSKPWFIIVLLSLALLIQNTCPFGKAGKTALSSLGGDCPLKHGMIVSHDMQKNLVADSSTAHFPHFIFDVSETDPSFRISPIIAAGPALADGYQHTLPDELLRPPQARPALT
jgi:hypothetical protein